MSDIDRAEALANFDESKPATRRALTAASSASGE
jgi:hypothetical protein